MRRSFFSLFVFFLIPGIIMAQENSLLETIVQSGHYAPVRAIDCSPDGRIIATGSEDKTIKLWEVSTGRELRSLTGHSATIRSVMFSPDGTQLLSVGYDRVAILWNVQDGQVVRHFRDSTDEIRSTIFSPKGNYILTGGHRTNAILWNRHSGEQIGTFKSKPEVCYQCASNMTFSADEKYLFTGSADRTTMVWNVNTFDTLASIKYNKGSCSSCNTYQDISPSGDILAKADYRGGLYLIDVKTLKQKNEIDPQQEFRKITFSPDGKYLMGIVNYSGMVVIWNATTKEKVGQIKPEYGINDACFSPDGKYIYTAGEDNYAKKWAVTGGSELKKYAGIITRVEEKGLNQDELHYINTLKDIALSPNGKYVAQGRRGNDVIIWDFETGRVVKQLKGHESVVTCLEFSPDSKILVTGSADRSIKLWNVESGELIRTIVAHNALLLSVNFSQEGSVLISSSWDGYFKVWSVESGKMLSLEKVHQGSPYATAISPNLVYAISGGLDRKLKMTELDSRELFRDFVGHSDVVQSIEFTPQGDRMLTASWDGSARLWDVYNGFIYRKFTGHQGKVLYASFDATGDRIVTASDDKKARLWNAKNGALIKSFEGHTGGVYFARITADGKHLITAAYDHTVKIWNLDSGKEVITHVTFNDGGWVAKNREGQFEGTPTATGKLFFVRGTRSYSLDQFFEQFYQPGIHRRSLTALESSATSGDVIGLLENSPPPEIEILAPLEDEEAQIDRVEFILKATNTGGDIGEIRILHNGKSLELPDRLGRTPKTGQDMVLTYSINLVPGENDIVITGLSKGRVESKPAQRSIFYKGTQKEANLYILAIGINEYKNPAMSLNYARSDAEAFVKLISSRSKKLFKKIETTVLLDEDATKEKVFNALNEIKQQAEKEDVVYFFYAGHGGIHQGEFYFIPTECVSLYQGDKLGEQAISATTVNSLLKAIPALKQVVILDACHSGASTQLLAARGMMEEKALAQLARSTGIHIMAAAGSEQQAVEFGQLGHGVFTYTLIEALQGKADGAPKDNKVTIYELKSYLDDQVPELSKKYQGSTQYPSTFSLGQDFPMVLGE